MEYEPQSIVHQVIRLERKITGHIKRRMSGKKSKEDQAVQDPSRIFDIVDEVINIVEEDSSIQDATTVPTSDTDIIH
jgi:hypothetical protein